LHTTGISEAHARPLGLDQERFMAFRRLTVKINPDYPDRDSFSTFNGCGIRAVSFSAYDQIWEGEAPAEPIQFAQITAWLGRSLALPGAAWCSWRTDYFTTTFIRL
jgi:hypothetical protein